MGAGVGGMTSALHLGDCLDVLRAMPADSVDAVVTDPPYELGFMGKSWDASGIAFRADTWREVLRVLKPGGHLLAFAGSRTYHRIACAVEDAGFEIRDQIMWIYGSGFPKSLDVGKAIDKLDAVDVRIERARRFQSWLRPLLTPQQVNEATETDMGHHLTTHPTQPAVPTERVFAALRPLVGEVPEWVEDLVRERTVESENAKRREIVGEAKMVDTTRSRMGFAGDRYGGTGDTRIVPITVGHTDEARTWQGWGTALKPAHEPIVVARKPLAGTVAANVLAHGTGALNIDGCRIGTGGESFSVPLADPANRRGIVGRAWQATGDAARNHAAQRASIARTETLGRWPANVIHDGSDEVVERFPQEAGAAAPVRGTESSMASVGNITGERARVPGAFHGDTGSAARFFYCAKASAEDRDEGLHGHRVVTAAEITGRKDGSLGLVFADGSPNPFAGVATDRRNVHPTVKPTDLMRYLVRLVTPPGGTVLDPFMGSGSTGKAAAFEGFDFVGIEREAEYFAIAQARIAYAEAAPKQTALELDAQPPDNRGDDRQQIDLFAA